MPSPERGVSAAVLRCAGRCLLLDCGEGTQVVLRREKVSPIKIDLIALTHYHGDHIFGLPGFLQTMNCLKREDPLFIIGPDGLEEALEPILKMGQDRLIMKCDWRPFQICMASACRPLTPNGLRERCCGRSRRNTEFPAKATLSRCQDAQSSSRKRQRPWASRFPCGSRSSKMIQ